MLAAFLLIGLGFLSLWAISRTRKVHHPTPPAAAWRYREDSDINMGPNLPEPDPDTEEPEEDEEVEIRVNPRLKKKAGKIRYKRIYWNKVPEAKKKWMLKNLTLNEDGGYSSIEGTLTDGTCKRPYIIVAYDSSKKRHPEVGWIVLNYAKNYNCDDDKHTYQIEAMPYVRLAYRRYHIGMNLFKRARKVAAKHKKKLVVFHHTTGSDTFYKECGKTFETEINF